MKASKKARYSLVGLLLLVALWLGFGYWDVIWVNGQHLYYEAQNAAQDRPITGSRIETQTFHFSTLGGAARELKVYLPASYDQSQQRYPVLYMLHGFPGADTDWLINENIGVALDKMIAAKTLPPLIAVFPDGNGPVVKDSEWINATKVDQPMEDYLLEVVKQVDQHYRTLADRQARALGGLSAGGYGAMNIGLRHNDVFATILAYSGYFVPDDKEMAKLVDSEQLRQNNSPLDYITGLHLDPQTYVYLMMGRQDAKIYLDQNQKMADLLQEAHLPSQYDQVDGRHTWSTWRNNLTPSLIFLGKSLSAMLNN
jgi:enterochelin esterase-like enzyme